MAFTYLSGRPSQKQIGYAGTSLPIQLQIPSMNHQVKWNRQVSWVQICLPCSQVFHWLRNLSFQKHDESIERIQWFYETDWVASTPRRQWCGEQTSTTTPAILTLDVYVSVQSSPSECGLNLAPGLQPAEHSNGVHSS